MPRKRQGSRLVRRKYKDQKSGKTLYKKDWYIRYFDGQLRKWRDLSTGEEDYDQAEEVLQEFKRNQKAVARGKRYPHDMYSVARVLDEYAQFKMGTSSAERLSYSMEHLLNFFGNDTLDGVNKEAIDRYYKTSNRARATNRRELTDLRSAISHAQEMDRIELFKFPKLGKKPEGTMKYLTREEVAMLHWSARKEYRTRFTLCLFLIIAYYSGARKGVIMDLKWVQIDFVKNTIDFRDPELEATNKRRAIVPMHPVLRSILLRRFRKYSNQSEYVFHQKKDPSKRVKSIDKGFRTSARRLNLNEVTPHTLRHTRVSEVAQAGEPIVNVAAFMAMSYQTIFEVYAHFNKDHLQDMANRIGRSHKNQTTSEKGDEITEK